LRTHTGPFQLFQERHSRFAEGDEYESLAVRFSRQMVPIHWLNRTAGLWKQGSDHAVIGHKTGTVISATRSGGNRMPGDKVFGHHVFFMVSPGSSFSWSVRIFFFMVRPDLLLHGPSGGTQQQSPPR